jgi:hypothetical protein
MPNILETASRLAALLKDSNRPFVMDLEFTVHVNPPLQGHLRLRWEAKDRWWSKVSMGKFEQIKFETGEQAYTLRNVDFTPKQVSDLMRLLHVGEFYDKLVTRAETQRTQGGVRLDCLDAAHSDPKLKLEHIEVCIDSATHDIVTETRKVPRYVSDELYRNRFSNFVDFGGHRYPREFESFKDEQLSLSAVVTGLQESPLDPKLLVPPPGAIERRECPDKKQPVVINQPTPNYNPHEHGSHQTDAQLTILANGSVGKVEIVGSAGRADDEVVAEALKRWKLKPAMCGSEAVLTDIYVTVVHNTQSIR